ncbi:MAG: sugar kinase [Hellea sp.]|nr:sugar kinase [Hellea sp.]
MAHKIVCFGEVLLRLAAPDGEQLLQTGKLNVHVGGAEANVSASLAQFGHHSVMATILPSNALGRAALAELRKYNVDTSAVLSVPGRMGLYFMSFGAAVRPSRIEYDRKDSAFALAGADAIDWDDVLKGATWLHMSGITPAIGENGTKAALRAVKAAKAAGVKVSFDGNYRAYLWENWKGDGPAIIREILSYATLALINERDISLVMGQTIKDRAEAFKIALKEFPELRALAATTRETITMDHHRISAELVTRTDRWESRPYNVAGIVDRIGGGDAFAVGLLHGLITDMARQDNIEFAAAASALKHSIRGDFNLVSINDVYYAMGNESLDVRR